MATKAPTTIDDLYQVADNNRKASNQRHAANQNIFTRKTLLLYFIASIFILVLHAIYIYNVDSVIDDAYITFRYSVNFANGLGLVYNPGEYVEGYTNFLWAFTLGIASFFRIDIIFAAMVLSFLATIGTILSLYWFAQYLCDNYKISSVVAGLPMLLFVSIGANVRYVVSGMETSLFVFFVTLSLYFLLNNQNAILTGILFGLTAMTRPEGVIYFVIAMIFSFINRQIEHKYSTKTIKTVIAFALLYAIYFFWRYSYYGYIFPNTYYAKASGFTISRLLRGWSYLIQVIRESDLEIFFLLSLLSILSLRLGRIGLFLGMLITITIAYFIYVGGDFIVWFGPRFIMPILPILFILAAIGLYQITSSRFVPSRLHTPIFAVCSLILIAHLLWFSWPTHFDRIPFFSAQMRSWKELGIWMHTHLSPTTTIATDGAGLIPYYSQLYTIDMLGLTDEHIAHLTIPNAGEGVVAHEKFDPSYIIARQPRCIVSTWMDAQGQAVSSGLLSVQQQFTASYGLVAVAKTRNGMPLDGRWVIETAQYSARLYSDGYVTGLFCMK